MNRFLTCTAVGLFLGLAPALAETQPPTDDAQTPPAVNEPSQIPEAMPDSSAPADPAAPVPGDSSQVTPSPMAPDDNAAPPAQSSQVTPSPMAPDDSAAPAQSSQAPLSIEPAAPKAADASGQFLDRQASDDWLASNLLGQVVYNGEDENIGEINDLVTDRNGKIVAVLIGSGGFLGIGEKDVAVRFEDLKLARDEGDNVKIIANLNKETLAAAPDYETLSEQKVTIGSTKGDREDVPAERTN
jgi:PRC-barrel domain